MKKQQVLALLKAHEADLARFAVRSLGIFGSVARDEARADSDVDLLVEFAKPVGLFEFVRLQAYLQELLGAKIDLVTEAALRPEFRQAVHRELVRAA